MSKFVGKRKCGKKFNIKNLKYAFIFAACILGAVIMIVAPAVFFGEPEADAPASIGTSNGTEGLGKTGDEQPADDIATYMFFRALSVTLSVGSSADDVLAIDEIAAVTEVKIENLDGTDNIYVTATRLPFVVRAFAKGSAKITVYANVRGERTSAAITVTVR